MTPRCDRCQQPLIGTALCNICARELEDLATERNDEWWTE